MKRWNDYQLKTKMFLAFSSVSLFIVILTIFFLYYKSVSDVKTQTYSFSNHITQQFNRTIELYIQDIERLSISIFGDPIIQSNLQDYYSARDEIAKNEIEISMNRQLFKHLHSRSNLESIYIFPLDQRAYYMARVNGPQVNFSLETVEWYHPDNENLYINDFFLYPTAEVITYRGSKEQVFSFVRNINRIPYRDVIAYMEINLSIDVFKNMIVDYDEQGVGSAMRVFIMSEEGHIVYDNKEQITGKKNSGLGELISQKGERSGEIEWNNNPYMYTIDKSDYTKWKTLVMIPMDTIISQQKRSLLLLLIIGFLVMVLIGIVSYVLSHQITLPLRYLKNQMNLVERGDFGKRVEVQGNNEIGRLSQIYNKMLDSITKLINEVYTSKLAEKNAQLTALQSQINPHFLYNTLNIMKSISRIKGVEEVAEMSESLAELFHYSMKDLQKPVALLEEIEHINNYMSIQQHRFNHRFEFQCTISEKLKHASVLKLTIQPLIENAIIHGLGKVNSGGLITLTVLEDKGDLVIEVTDNGQGMDKESLSRLNKILNMPSGINEFQDDDSQGIGLRNIQQRIQLRYGENYGVELRGALGQGTTVQLTFPNIDHRKKEAFDTNEHFSSGG